MFKECSYKLLRCIDANYEGLRIKSLSDDKGKSHEKFESVNCSFHYATVILVL